MKTIYETMKMNDLTNETMNAIVDRIIGEVRLYQQKASYSESELEKKIHVIVKEEMQNVNYYVDAYKLKRQR